MVALTPRSGSSPAWAARPSTSIRKLPTPLRAVFRAPPADGSSTRTASRPSAVCSTSWREVVDPTSSSLVTNTATPSRSPNRVKASNSWTSPAFMSKAPGPVAREGEGPSLDRAGGPHRVEVAEEQDARRPELPKKMNPAVDHDRLRFDTQPPARELAHRVGAGRGGAGIFRGGLALDQPTQVVAQLGDGGHRPASGGWASEVKTRARNSPSSASARGTSREADDLNTGLAHARSWVPTRRPRPGEPSSPSGGGPPIVGEDHSRPWPWCRPPRRAGGRDGRVGR